MSRPAQPRLTVVHRADPADRPVLGDSEVPTLGAAFRAYGGYVARVGTRILGYDAEEIDDLVQDVFTEAAAGLPALRGPGALKGWLATVTVRVAVRRLRARRLRRLLFRPDDTAPPVAWAGASPEQCAVIARVYELLRRLPPRQHAAWVLRHVEGDSLDDIARRCECSLPTAKRLIAKAEAWLERKLR